MSDWILIPSLKALRDEFNAIAPGRDKGADGSIGDSSHTSSSDHTPDEDSDVLRGKDADSINEVHALDIDSTGPWPVPFSTLVARVIAQDRTRWLDPADKCRLNYAIFNRLIYDKDNDFAPVTYTGSDPHTNHAHFSSRYETVCENDTSPWGVESAVDMSLDTNDVTTLAKTDGVFDGPSMAASVKDGTNTKWTLNGFLSDAGNYHRIVNGKIDQLSADLTALKAQIEALAAVITPPAGK